MIEKMQVGKNKIEFGRNFNEFYSSLAFLPLLSPLLFLLLLPLSNSLTTSLTHSLTLVPLFLLRLKLWDFTVS